MWSQTAVWSKLFSSNPVADYWRDACERSILYWDVLHDRGADYLQHVQSGKPPVLVFDYKIILDGRSLPDPANYALAAILPPAGCPATNPALRPFVVIDPRAGHGPGIGGFKMDSEIGIALQQGHPCYFIMFFPQPVPSQTIESVSRAEYVFLGKVRELHPDSDGKPFVIGNCQGGWALAMLASVAPELCGPILLAGTPLSYWAGVTGKYPMRYSGGMLGGTWTASLAGDLGNGKFDGAHLVNNFEKLDPANTLWKKPYNLYAKVDTERERYLGFERWWGGHYLLNKQEMEWISQQLFVGNHLVEGKIVSSDQHRVDMRNIRSPIIVFASWGDNITPPQQALNWIPDLYDNAEDIRDNEQTIIYCLHNKVGHLGIFVSAGIANREHSEFASALDLIDVLAPGLYEAVIEDVAPGTPGQEYIKGRYIIRFEAREVADILALDDGREDERAFEAVRRVSEINQGIYNRFVSPAVRAVSNEASAQWLRQLNPARLERTLISPLNPWLGWLKPAAEYVRAHRQPVSADNPLWRLQEQWSGWMTQSLDRYRDLRDAATEHCFKAVYESPWLASVVGVQPAREARAARCDSWNKQERLQLKRQVLDPAYESGSLADGFVRLLTYVAIGRGIIDERPFNAIRRIMRDIRHEYPLTLMELKDIARKQVFLVRLDEARALAGLPKLLPEEHRRRQAWQLAHELLALSGDIAPEQQLRLDQAAHALQLDTRAPAAPAILPPAEPAIAAASTVPAAAPAAKASAPAKKAAPPRKPAAKAPSKPTAGKPSAAAAKPAPAAKPASSKPAAAKPAPGKPPAAKTAKAPAGKASVVKAPAAKTPAARKPAAGKDAAKPKTPSN
ncbi:DUF3141 domain-containing protein [Chromobacterium sp. Beijing]|uniref:DUF3141 domain-containing protein n=1 Tax=Chromobacterium sp. Beijing TaxID=2735795 RepID=UPI002105EC83|nr:DUF3141 domain-containing protein [Chromobacterium sp. Beijing]UJB31227.1 DUF3141 domain-containing protein [Chromobacterium sp. Beijing]